LAAPRLIPGGDGADVPEATEHAVELALKCIAVETHGVAGDDTQDREAQAVFVPHSLVTPPSVPTAAEGTTSGFAL